MPAAAACEIALLGTSIRMLRFSAKAMNGISGVPMFAIPERHSTSRALCTPELRAADVRRGNNRLASARTDSFHIRFRRHEFGIFNPFKLNG
jgi:hypothetical protein